jgi:hypothetical protein
MARCRSRFDRRLQLGPRRGSGDAAARLRSDCQHRLVEEIAALVARLASEECSFSTGGVFDISGGRATY